MRIASVGHAVFAATMIAAGVFGLVQGNFAPMWSGVPQGFPGRVGLAYLCALVSLACGLGLLWQPTAAVAARALLASFGVWLLVFRLPLLVRAPASTGSWWAMGDSAVLVAAAWVLCTWFTGDDRGRPSVAAGGGGLRMARMVYGLGLIPFGVAHFTFLARTVSMVPGWLPWHLAWAMVTGGALIAAGLAVLTNLYAPLAARLSAIQLGLFTLLVWVPTIAAHPRPSDWTEFATSCVLTAAAWVVADSYRGMRWFAVERELAPTAA